MEKGGTWLQAAGQALMPVLSIRPGGHLSGVVDEHAHRLKLILAYKIFSPFDQLLGYRHSKSSIRKIIILFIGYGSIRIILAV